MSYFNSGIPLSLFHNNVFFLFWISSAFKWSHLVLSGICFLVLPWNYSLTFHICMIRIFSRQESCSNSLLHRRTDTRKSRAMYLCIDTKAQGMRMGHLGHFLFSFLAFRLFFFFNVLERAHQDRQRWRKWPSNHSGACPPLTCAALAELTVKYGRTRAAEIQSD